jgi:hypothetical protein
MKCLICDSKQEFYFTKDFTEEPFSIILKEDNKFNYFRCPHCGFVSSDLCERSEDEFLRINKDVHEAVEGMKTYGNDPPYLEQAVLISILLRQEIISDIFDYAAGTGVLKQILLAYFNIYINSYDRYRGGNELRKHNTVVNSAMLEHVRTRKDLEDLNNLAFDTLIIHTVVCENIPDEPLWFYFRPPVHCAFHTNKSMSILMEQWGYKFSAYCLKAKSWVLLKKEIDIRNINLILRENYLLYTNGFLNYWK